MKYLSVGQQWVLLIIALFLLGSFYYKFSYPPPPPSSEEFMEEVIIEVSGDVRNPGIYPFRHPPTLREAIEMAGGLKETAEFDTTLSQEILGTGDLVTVTKESTQVPFPLPLPKGIQRETKQEAIKIKISRMAADKLLVFSIPIDLNRASLEDLCLIPGIGQDLAQEIIVYRERRKGFRSVEEIKNVRGIGEKKYQSFKAFFIIKHEGTPKEIY